ncbi:MAG: DUF1800 domain-containing protein [Leptospiraceae bacterium]|nr:DUF1800 domain-containing protein [Leptospiraceae bacterium]
MKFISLVLFFFYISGSIYSISYEEARHLLHRTGFGASEDEIQALIPLDYEKAVENLLNNTRTTAIGKKPNLNEKKKLREKLQIWWIEEMLDTPSPFTERMVLFWHNHFVSAMSKVPPKFMYKQNLLYRKNAFGNFAVLLEEITKDPAMILYLDLQSNKAEAPNENFARELFELFTLGEGKYSEEDIKQAAKAFTGYSIKHKTGEFHFNKNQHDISKKNCMGVSGRLIGEDIIKEALIKKRGMDVAKFITKKVWLEFVSNKINNKEIQRIAKVFHGSNFEIKILMKEILMAEDFRNPDNYGTMIKSPIELIVGTLRTLDSDVENTGTLISFSKRMGQDILNPPSVKGWEGKELWISTHSLAVRKQFLTRVTRGQEMKRKKQMMMMKVSSESPLNWEFTPKNKTKLLSLLLPIPSVFQPEEEDDDMDDFVHWALIDPAYQMK